MILAHPFNDSLISSNYKSSSVISTTTAGAFTGLLDFVFFFTGLSGLSCYSVALWRASIC